MGLAGCAVAPVAAPESMEMFRPTFADVAYAQKSPAEKLDLYLPAATGTPAPLVIWIHGGGFRLGDKRSIRRRNVGPPPRPTGPDGPYQIQVPDVVALTSKGYGVAAINYRLGPSMGTAAIAAIQDGKAAVRYLRANAGTYHLDPSKFAAWGDSAGGYMAAMLGATGDQRTLFDTPNLGDAGTSSAVQAVVVWFGAEDRLPGAELGIAHYLPNAAVLPPFMIANGDADPIISPEQAGRLHAALLEAGARSTLTILPGAGHEDPAFMATQMLPTFQFLDRTFGRIAGR
ncbi:MAG TPA: alpha/beta hydrolase [Polyangia bacterium]|nr:alpha/beta hydrolase [Polyangia bacterium]